MLGFFFCNFIRVHIVCECWHVLQCLCGEQKTAFSSQFYCGVHIELRSSDCASCCSDRHHNQKPFTGGKGYALRSQFITDGSQGWNWSRNHGGMVFAGLLPSLCSATPLISPGPPAEERFCPQLAGPSHFHHRWRQLLTDKTTSQSDVGRSSVRFSSWPSVVSSRS